MQCGLEHCSTSTMQPLETTTSTRQTSANNSPGGNNNKHPTIVQTNKFPFPTVNKYLRWQDWSIPIPFIPIKRPVPLIFSAIVLVLGAYWNGVLAIVGQDRQYRNLHSMPDVFQDWFPITYNYTPYAHNIYVGIWGALTVIRFLPTRSFFWEIVRRFLFIWGIMFFLRGCTDGLTQEPKARYNCVPTYVGENVFGKGGSYIFGGAHTCSDLMFSGHTVAFVLLTLQWTNYSTGAEFAWLCGGNRTPKWLQRLFLPTFTATGDVNSTTVTTWFAWFVAIGGFIVLITDHAHYSVDIWVAYLMTFAIYKLYLYYIKTVYDHDTWFSDFVIWFEGVTPPVPGQATLSVMTCAGYSYKTTAALPSQWTWYDVAQPPAYDIESQEYAQQHGDVPPIYARQNTQPRGQSYPTMAIPNNSSLSTMNTESVADQHATQQPFRGAIPLSSVATQPGTSNSGMATAPTTYDPNTPYGNNGVVNLA